MAVGKGWGEGALAFPPPPPASPFSGAKVFFPRKTGKNKIFICEEHLKLVFIC